MKMKWIKTKDNLPDEGKYVLARHDRGTWSDSTDKENVNCVVVKLVRGISLEDREALKNGLVPQEVVRARDSDGSIHTIGRSDCWHTADESGNNKRPYCWESFGSDTFFGQDITHWMPIPPI